MKEEAEICLFACHKFWGSIQIGLLGKINFFVEITPLQKTARFRHQKEWGFAYNVHKSIVDICIGIGTVVMMIGVPGKFVLLPFTKFSDGYANYPLCT